MINCIVCEEVDCQTTHTAEEIRAVSVFGCYVCQEHGCTVEHTLEELRNPLPLKPEELRRALQICILYSRIVESWG